MKVSRLPQVQQISEYTRASARACQMTSLSILAGIELLSRDPRDWLPRRLNTTYGKVPEYHEDGPIR